MPRYSRIPAILRTVQHAQPKVEPKQGGPRLWNAKRRIQDSQPLTPAELSHYRKNPSSTAWRTQTSPDVVEFIDRNTIDQQTGNPLPLGAGLLPNEITNILRNPTRYFSRPQHVPLHSRKQIYLPEFSVTMIRKPKDSPFFASFQVPLWFNKLDMKSYLKELYDVDVIHVRSFVLEKSLVRKRHHNPRRQGAWHRATSEKRMKVQLVEPFQWPAELTDFQEAEKDEYWRIVKAQTDEQNMLSIRGKLKADNWYRHTIAKQASDLLAGRDKWAPSWEQIPSERHVFDGLNQPPQKPERTPNSKRKNNDVRIVHNLPLRNRALENPDVKKTQVPEHLQNKVEKSWSPTAV